MVIIKEVGKWRWVILALVLLTVAILVNRACTSDADSQYWKGQYDSLKEITDIESDILLADIDKLHGVIEDAQKAIELLTITRVEQERRINLLEFERQDLVESEPSQPELESEPLVINLRAQIAKMSLVIYEQEQIIRGNDEIIFNLVEKYEAQLIISEDYKKLYENEQRLHFLAVKRLSVTENRVRGLRFGHSLKNAGFVIVIGTLIYVIAN